MLQPLAVAVLLQHLVGHLLRDGARRNWAFGAREPAPQLGAQNTTNKHQDPTNIDFWTPLVLGLKTRILDPYVCDFWGPYQCGSELVNKATILPRAFASHTPQQLRIRLWTWYLEAHCKWAFDPASNWGNLIKPVMASVFGVDGPREKVVVSGQGLLQQGDMVCGLCEPLSTLLLRG